MLLAGSLSAICVYLNCHRYAIKIFESERKHSLSVRIDDSDSGFLITFETRDGWICKTGKKEDLASASLTFKNKKLPVRQRRGLLIHGMP